MKHDKDVYKAYREDAWNEFQIILPTLSEISEPVPHMSTLFNCIRTFHLL